MRILVVLAHPQPGSLNHAIAHAAVRALEDAGHVVILCDLCAEGLDPLLPCEEIPEDGPVDETIRQHCAELVSADGLVIVHPNWWGQPPAIMKGWIDRVFRPGVAYRFLEDDSGEGVPVGLLKARTAVVFNTSNTPEERELRAFGDPLETIWRNCILGLCGVTEFHRRMFRVVVTSSSEQREAWLREVREIVARCFPRERADSTTQSI